MRALRVRVMEGWTELARSIASNGADRVLTRAALHASTRPTEMLRCRRHGAAAASSCR